MLVLKKRIVDPYSSFEEIQKIQNSLYNELNLD